MNRFNQHVLSASIATILGTPALLASPAASADTVTAQWSGVTSFLGASGVHFTDPDVSACLTEAQANAWNGAATYTGGCTRSYAAGTITYDTASGSGSATIATLSFDGIPMTTDPMTFQSIGNGSGGSGTLFLGNTLFDWNGTYDIPLSIVWDGAGLLSALSGGVAVSQNLTGGATPASENGDGAFNGGGILATTTWNTTSIAPPVALGDNPSGTLPLIADTVGGSPMQIGPFNGANFNFDLMSVQITGCTDTDGTSYACAPAAVPIPATAWLFGSGVLGLAGLARRRRAS